MRYLKGSPVSEGVAIGHLYIYSPFKYEPVERKISPDEVSSETARYEASLLSADRELCAITEKLGDDDKAKIFAAHREILEDEELDEEIRSLIEAQLFGAEYAVYRVYTDFAHILSAASDPLIAERGADLEDVRSRLLRILSGEKEKDLSSLPADVIVAARELLPSDTATMDRDRVLGIVTQTGGSTSHSAIIARSFGIPAVLGVEGVSELKDGQLCILDALEGTLCLEPDEAELGRCGEKRERFLSDRQTAQEFRNREGLTADGERILIGLNAGSAAESEDCSCCDFIGLLRTEFLYMHSDHLSTEEEQLRAYASVLKNASGRPVTLRTLDIGGDKTLKYMPLPREDNPFLGERALRLCLNNPDIFRTQLRAALRASAQGPVQLMFPMVATIDDIRNAKAAVERVKEELRNEKLDFDESIPLGIMIEIPSIVEISDLAADEVDFASVGTNDLTQYLHAADRMNPRITEYYQSFSPAVFRVLARIFRAFGEAGKPVSVCGELGGNPLAVIPMVGLGLRKTSMSGSSVASVKRALSRFSMAEARELGDKVCCLPTQEDVLTLLRRSFSEKGLMW